MTCVLLFALVVLPPGDSTLLRYRMPDAVTSIFDIDASSNVAEGLPDHATWLDVGLTPHFHSLALGERLNLKADGALDGLARRSSASGSSSYVNLLPYVSVALNWYPISFPVGLSTALSGSAGYSEEHFVSSADSGFKKRVLLSYGVRGVVGVGPCLGRFRDARTVITALRICEILKQEKQSGHNPDADDIEMLAELLAMKPVVGLRFHRPEKNWFADLETLLRNRGLVGIRVPARVWFLIRDAIEGTETIARPVGFQFSIRPGLSEDWSSHSDSSADSVFQRDSLLTRPLLALHLESGYPLSRRWQFTQTADWSITAESAFARQQLSAEVAVDYHIFDRLIASLAYAGSYDSHGSYGYEPGLDVRWHYWRHGPEAALNWYREDAFDIKASLGLTQSGYRAGTATGPANSSVTFNWSIGVSYRLLP